MEMNIRNREADVGRLRTNICQDFLRMVITDNWKTDLYNKCFSEINGPHKEKYRNAYQQMRDNGIEEYSIDKMDVSFIGTIISFCGNIAPVSSKVKKAFKDLVIDRNDKGHSNENEEDAELYLRAMVHLYDLKHFVRSIDDNEHSISDEKRGSFRKKYIKEIDTLMDLIDEERINLVQKTKQINKEIDYINNSEGEEQERRKYVLFEKYYNIWNEQNRLNHDILKKNGWVESEDLEEPQKNYYTLMVEASNRGYIWAHLDAAEYYYITRNCVEFEKRVLSFLDSVDDIDNKVAADLFRMLRNIQTLIVYFKVKYDFSKTEQTILNRLKEHGYKIEKDKNGIYIM